MRPSHSSEQISTRRTQPKTESYTHALQLLRRNLLLGRDRGNSIVFALIFAFVVIATSLAISSRGRFSLLGSVFNQESKLARDAAEVGLLRSVMLLNEPENRMLLVNAGVINGSTGTEISANSDLVNPCVGGQPNVTVGSGSAMAIKTAGSNAYPTINIDDGNALLGNIQRSFKIISITQGPGTPDLVNKTAGEIIITVEGYARKSNGELISSSRITRRLEVLEKCCGLSLGGRDQAFGADDRLCDQENPGLGLLAGTWLQNTGLFETTGGAGITFLTGDGSYIPNVYCLDVSAPDCGADDFSSGTGTELVGVKPEFRDVPPAPAQISAGAAKSCDGITTDECNIYINDDLTLSVDDFANWDSLPPLNTVTVYYSTSSLSTVVVPVSESTSVRANILQCEGNGQPVATCKNKNNTYTGSPAFITVVNTIYSTSTITVAGTSMSTTVLPANTSLISEIAELKNRCHQVQEKVLPSDTTLTTVTYCSLNQLKIDNNKSLTFNTLSAGGQNFPIRFYFPNPSNQASPSIQLLNGQSAIVQASTTDYKNLIFYGMSRIQATTKCDLTLPSCQYVQLGGGNAGTTTFFAYFPTAYTELFGSATLNGMVWSNVIEIIGSVDFVSEGAGVGSVLDMLGIASQENPDATGPILTDFVTRLTKRFSFFG